jgi:nucleoredoxin
VAFKTISPDRITSFNERNFAILVQRTLWGDRVDGTTKDTKQDLLQIVIREEDIFFGKMSSENLRNLLGDYVINGNFGTVAVDSLQSKTAIGFYFSASWCPPCRQFTPVLIETYQKLKNQLEIVFVSSDTNEDEFKNYFKKMPWLAVDFHDQTRRDQLSSKYGVHGIPTLVIVDRNGQLLTTDGRYAVTSDPDGKQFPWKDFKASPVQFLMPVLQITFWLVTIYLLFYLFK